MFQDLLTPLILPRQYGRLKDQLQSLLWCALEIYSLRFLYYHRRVYHVDIFLLCLTLGSHTDDWFLHSADLWLFHWLLFERWLDKVAEWLGLLEVLHFLCLFCQVILVSFEHQASKVGSGMILVVILALDWDKDGLRDTRFASVKAIEVIAAFSRLFRYHCMLWYFFKRRHVFVLLIERPGQTVFRSHLSGIRPLIYTVLAHENVDSIVDAHFVIFCHQVHWLGW